MVTYGLMETWINDLDRMIRITDKKEKIDMKKKVLTAVLMMSMVMGSSLTVCAAPETMADGTVFDAEYYAQMYSDVVAALGTDADALYNHYVTFGRNEGRLPYEPGTAQTIKVSAPTIKTGMTPDEVLVFIDTLYVTYPEFMLTDSRPIKANRWTERGNGFGSRPVDVATYSYDNEGRLTSANQVGEPKRAYAYDEQGRMIRCDSLEWPVSAYFKYDEQGRIKQFESDGAIYNLKYSDSGSLISMEGGFHYTKQFGYDTQNKLVWSTEAGDDWSERYDYMYDEFGRLIKKTKGFTYEEDGHGYVIEYIYNYDERGRMLNKIKYYNGKLDEQLDFIYE